LPIADFSTEQMVYAAPRNRLEARLCQMWSNLLPRTELGVDDDFFRSGGDSITALQLAIQVQRELKRKVSVKDIFDFPTVRSFVGNVLGGTADESNRTEVASLTGCCPMLPIQKWFFAKPLGSRGHWNQYFAIRTPPLDFDKLQDALNKLVDHHDAFRLRFRCLFADNAGSFEQFYSDGRPEILLHSLDIGGLRHEDVRARLEDWQSRFDLELGPMYCAAYLHGFDDGSARVWFALHHLIVDTVSWRILTQDLEILYNGGDLGARGSSYRDWAKAVRSYVPYHNEAQLWAEIADCVAMQAGGMQLVPTGMGSYHDRFVLGEWEMQRLLMESNRAYDTHIIDLLLTAVGLALRELTQRATNYVTLEGHGREAFDGAPAVRDTLGWFTTMHPIAVWAGEDLGRNIAFVKTNRQHVPHNGIGYGAIRGTYGSIQAPLPPVSFNYLGRFGDGAPVKGQLALRESARWHLDATLCGTSRAAGDEHANDCAIDVTMSCVGGRLVTEVDSRLTLATTKRFTAKLKTHLEEIISHTTAVVSGRSGCANRAAARALPVADDFDPYILANEGETGPFLFIFPPGEGGAESYLNNLARQLSGHRLVLFNNVHLRRPMQSFEIIAQYYLTYVRRLQPSGPYNLLGWSFGGVLSLELALQLTRAGQTISNLFFIDSFFNVKKALADVGLPEFETILDPIHYHYAPNETYLKRLRASTDNVVLFKATKPSDTVQGESQRRLFDYYARSRFNNLDTLLRPPSFAVELLAGDTHFSWVHNEHSVATIGLRIRALVQGLATVSRALTPPAVSEPSNELDLPEQFAQRGQAVTWPGEATGIL
jgi:N-(5-amino-5-carboxypentanoyl)-L-cysteinyl-D-valine synthase